MTEPARIQRAAKRICARGLGGFCHNVGGDLGCRVGRGLPPDPENCIATDIQLQLTGDWDTAQSILEDDQC